jgi:molybdopterin synthase sulfur carrier subunit
MIELTGNLSNYTNGQKNLPFYGDTVKAVLGSIQVMYPQLRANLLTEDGKIRSGVKVFLNDKEMRLPEDYDVAISERDSIFMMTPFAGG